MRTVRELPDFRTEGCVGEPSPGTKSNQLSWGPSDLGVIHLSRSRRFGPILGREASERTRQPDRGRSTAGREAASVGPAHRPAEFPVRAGRRQKTAPVRASHPHARLTRAPNSLFVQYESKQWRLFARHTRPHAPRGRRIWCSSRTKAKNDHRTVATGTQRHHRRKHDRASDQPGGVHDTRDRYPSSPRRRHPQQSAREAPGGRPAPGRPVRRALGSGSARRPSASEPGRGRPRRPRRGRAHRDPSVTPSARRPGTPPSRTRAPWGPRADRPAVRAGSRPCRERSRRGRRGPRTQRASRSWRRSPPRA